MVMLPAYFSPPMQVQASVPQSPAPHWDSFSSPYIHDSFSSPSMPKATSHSIPNHSMTPIPAQTVRKSVTPKKSSNQPFQDPENINPSMPTKSPTKKRR
ncbi:unnamed protein product [Somion occarium]|uniref:Uncharacterized protein n=1 Tax=Somion occarium TaxID=3059160 RepID=A0ABP1CVF2_9APHY